LYALGLSGGSSKRLRNAVAAEGQTTIVRLPGEPGSLSFFSSAHNSGSAQLPKNVSRREAVNDPKNEALANLEDYDPAFIKSRKWLELWQRFLLRMNTAFRCRFANPKYGDHDAELLMASCFSRCRIASSKRGIP
jgi:hypothetical protein